MLQVHGAHCQRCSTGGGADKGRHVHPTACWVLGSIAGLAQQYCAAYSWRQPIPSVGSTKLSRARRAARSAADRVIMIKPEFMQSKCGALTSGVLVCWCVGVLVCWCVGVLVCWSVGRLVWGVLGRTRRPAAVVYQYEVSFAKSSFQLRNLGRCQFRPNNHG